jgi:L-iditol 2-dehydrogenase
VTLHGIMKTGVFAGDSVAVFGCGGIGLFAVQFAKILGATKVIAVDIEEDKLQLAKSIGADFCINSVKDDAVKMIKELTSGKGVHLAVETAGVSFTQEQCLRAVKKQGRVLYLGTSHKDVLIPPFSFECIVRNELKITGAWNSYSVPFPGVEWHAALDYIKAGKLQILPLISHIFKLSEASEVFKDLYSKKFKYNKVIFNMEEQ